MEPIISYGIIGSGSSGLTATEDPRIVVSYPSGLVRVDQNYFCHATNTAAARASLAPGEPMPDGNEDPAIDGLFIFPAPQESTEGDITTFTVSAYGRTQTTLQNVVLTQQQLQTRTASAPYTPISFSVWVATGAIATLAGEALDLDTLEISANIYEPFDFYLSSQPTYKTHYVTEEEVRTATATVQTITIGGKTIHGPVATARTSRRFRVRLTADGTTTAYTFDLWLTDPTLNITAQRPFGTFMEMEISLTRGDATTATV